METFSAKRKQPSWFVRTFGKTDPVWRDMGFEGPYDKKLAVFNVGRIAAVAAIAGLICAENSGHSLSQVFNGQNGQEEMLLADAADPAAIKMVSSGQDNITGPLSLSYEVSP